MRRIPDHPGPDCASPCRPAHGRRGFTVIELIVCLGVVVILCGILLPSLRGAREAAHRISCQSNMHQIGVAIVTWSNLHESDQPGSVPSSRNSLNPRNQNPNPRDLMAVRLSAGASDPNGWDGLGLLVQAQLLGNCQCLYCASHHGEHSFDRYADDYADGRGARQIFTNYQYGGDARPIASADGPDSTAPVTLGSGREALLLTDGLRTRSDFNHRVGLNRMFADLSIEWWQDEGNALLHQLPETASGSEDYRAIWSRVSSVDGGMP